MGTGLELVGLALTIGSAAMSIAQGAAQQSQARRQYRDQVEATNRQTQLQYSEIQRQQVEVNKVASEQTSDRVRKASQELGTLRVLTGEMGSSGNTFVSLAGEIAYYEGVDLARIEGNRESNIEAGEASKQAAKQGAINSLNLASNQMQVQSTATAFNTVGTMLGIGQSIYGQRVKSSERAKDREAIRRIALPTVS